MSSFTANSTAAYFTYIGQWTRNSTQDPGGRLWRQGDSVKLRAQGSTLHLFGNIPPDPNNPNNNITSAYTISVFNDRIPNPPCFGTATTSEQAICKIPLNEHGSTDLTLSLNALDEGVSGLSFTRIEWTDPSVRNQPKQPISGSSASVDTTVWTPDLNESSCTTSDGSNIAFNFEGEDVLQFGVPQLTEIMRTGTGVLVKGMATSQRLNASYSVRVNNITILAPGGSELWEAYASPNQEIDLYRNDTLNNTNNVVSFLNIQPRSQFCVLRADVFGPVVSPTSTPPSSTPSSALPEPTLPQGRRITGGQTAGVVIGVLIIVGMVIAGILFVYRRRTRFGGVALDAKKLRYCSKCGSPIVDRYRMECVQAGSCVQDVDLHLKCEDWNTPINHSHPVHKVAND